MVEARNPLPEYTGSGPKHPGVLALFHNAELKAGPKEVFLEKIHRDNDMDYTIYGEGPGMDDEAEKKGFLSDWVTEVCGLLQGHTSYINESDFHFQYRAFIQLWKHFFEPRRKICD